MNGLVVRRLFEGGHYNAQPWDCAAPIRGRLLNGVRRLFEEIRYIYQESQICSISYCARFARSINIIIYQESQICTISYRARFARSIINFYTCIYIYTHMSVRNFVYSKDLERSCGQYSVTNCRCDVSAFDLRKSMCRLSKIDVATFEDRCIALRRSTIDVTMC